MTEMNTINMMSIDVEDYFHVSAFEGISPPSSWNERECRVERNTDRLLSLLNEHETKATFFVLGWVAERFPALVKSIFAEGHEISSHGFWHQRISEQCREAFREDVRKSKHLLEDLIGQQVVGYRAPSYSISTSTFWAFDELYDAGYQYDSSVFPVKHDFYGMPNWPRFAGKAVKMHDGSWQPAEDASGKEKALHEIPISTLSVAGKNVPVAGGGYFRLYPYNFSRWALNRINKKDRKPFLFYLHPWELDHQQPKMYGAGLKSNFRHYLNLTKTESRLKALIQDFQFTTISNAVSLQ
jgi:polysaccharide deacetylase family protein (PEP-CTERM system associated)